MNVGLWQLLTHVFYGVVMVVAVVVIVGSIIAYLLRFFHETQCTEDCDQGRKCECEENKVGQKEKFTFAHHQRIAYDNDLIDVYFDVTMDGDTPYMSDDAQAYYKGANITEMVNWAKVDGAADWERIEREAREMEY
jgi:hypothetical protein